MGDFWLLEMCFSKNPLGRTFLLKSSWIHGRLLLVLMGGLDLFSRKPNFTHTNSFPEVSFLPSHFCFFGVTCSCFKPSFICILHHQKINILQVSFPPSHVSVCKRHGFPLNLKPYRSYLLSWRRCFRMFFFWRSSHTYHLQVVWLDFLQRKWTGPCIASSLSIQPMDFAILPWVPSWNDRSMPLPRHKCKCWEAPNKYTWRIIPFSK